MDHLQGPDLLGDRFLNHPVLALSVVKLVVPASDLLLSPRDFSLLHGDHVHLILATLARELLLLAQPFSTGLEKLP